MHMKKRLLFTIAVVTILLLTLTLASGKVDAPSFLNFTGASKNSSNQVEPKPSFDKNQFSLTEPTSPWVVVNKQNPLPKSYVPDDLESTKDGDSLRVDALENLNNLLSTAAKSKFAFSTISSYRSYTKQMSTYNGFVARDGQAKADTYSARPGYSEHQSGWAADMGTGNCDLQICFGDTGAGKWLAENAHKFGFIIRYPLDKDSITGYQYEPWHIRFVGAQLADEIYKSNQTMEEFFGLPPAPDYL